MLMFLSSLTHKPHPSLSLMQTTLEVGGYLTTGFSSGTDALTSDMEGAAGRKKEKKKKTKKVSQDHMMVHLKLL